MTSHRARNIFKIIFLTFTICCLFFISIPAKAQQLDLGNDELSNFGQTVGYGQASLPQIIGRIVRIILSLLGIAAVIIMIIGGFIWITSGGSSEKVEKAKKIIVNGLIGLLIIVFAYALTSFVMEKLGFILDPEPIPISDCIPGECCGFGYRCSVNKSCNIPDSSCSPSPNAFKIKKIETTHGGLEQNYNQDVYLCSAVQPIFNRAVKTSSVQELAETGELKVENVNGNWQIRNNVLIFKHPEIFDINKTYRAYFPKAILDFQSKYLQQCLAAGGCSETASHFIWDFTTGEQNDEIPPEIVSAYPIFNSEDPSYPDQNVSRSPLIEVKFSEPIDITTVSDENDYPLEENIWLAALDGQNGNVVQILSKENFQINGDSNGFKLKLRDGNLLESFIWYRVHIEGIEDLCLNSMTEAAEWEFQTNDRVPGIKSYYPNNKTVCPDTDISVVFETQMYNSLVTMEITDGRDNFSISLNPSELEPPYEKRISNGVFKVSDFGAPVNNHFRIFTFNPDNNLKDNTEYKVKVFTDLIINQQGNFLSGEWSFKTADLENCLCSPWISHITPSQGLRGECLTIYGQCFKGTNWQTAEPIRIEFILNDITTLSIIGGFDNNYLTTVVPEIYVKGDRPNIQAVIQYQSGEQMNSNQVDFYVNSDNQADGPCLLSINPSIGYPEETKVNLNGLRFNSPANSSKVIFYNNQEAVYSNWADQNINGAIVPLNAQNGPVTVVNEKGKSNGLPFDILSHLNKPGGVCYQSYYCSENPMYECESPVYSCLHEPEDTCRCCCNVSPNSCPAPLECTAGQGSCTGADRGLCCGCRNDDQCGSLLGCALNDPNRCCYPRPNVVNHNPVGNNVCLNTAVEIDFDSRLNPNSLNNNISFKKLASLTTAKNGKDYEAVEKTKCIYETDIYTGSCENNYWDYEFTISQKGEHNLYVETSNYFGEIKDLGEDNKCSEPGIQHHIRVFVDNEEKESFCADASLVSQFSYISLGEMTEGPHLIRLLWDNDWTQPGAGDSNLRIHQVGIMQTNEEKTGFNLVVNNDNNKIILYPDNCQLEPTSIYEIKLIGGQDGRGIKSDLGVSMNDYTWQFSTGAEDRFCLVSQVRVNPEKAEVTSFKENVVYVGQAYDFNNNQVCVAGFDWQSSDITIASLSRQTGLATTASPVSGSIEGETANIFADASNIVGSGEFISILNPPIIKSINPISGSNNPKVPTYVTIFGSNFGFTQGENTVKFGNIVAEIGCNNWSDKEIVAIVPQGLIIDKDYPLTVVNAEQGTSNEIDFTVNNEFHPAICELQPNYGKTGTKITIKGVNFGDRQENSYVVFGKGNNDQQIITNSGKWSNEKIEIIAPAISEGQAGIEVWVPSPLETDHPLKPSNTVTFYQEPLITGISPAQGPRGTWITIKGNNFTSEQGVVYFRYDGQDYPSDPLPDYCPNKWTDKEIIVAVPQELPTVAVNQDFYNLQIYLKPKESVNSNLFDWRLNKNPLPPALCQLIPDNGYEGFYPLTIKGLGFDLKPGEQERKLIFNPGKETSSLTWLSDMEINNITVPQGAQSGSIKVNKKAKINCRLECSNLSFAGQCFGDWIEVCDDIFLESNPLSFDLVDLGGCGFFGTLGTRDGLPIKIGEKINDYPPTEPFDSQSVGVLATDGKYLYGKSWTNYDRWSPGTYDCASEQGCPDNVITKIGTGYQGTIAGQVYGDLANVHSSLTMTYYPDGYLYNGYTTDGYHIERVNAQTGSVDTIVNIPAGLIVRDTGQTATGPYGGHLITSDGEYIYNLAYSLSSGYNGFRVRVFDPNDNWKLIREWDSRGSDYGYDEDSFYTDGIIADGDYVYAIEWTGKIRKMNAQTGQVVSEWTTDQKLKTNPDGNNADFISGQYDWINNKIWLGDLVPQERCDQCPIGSAYYCHCTPAYVYHYACRKNLPWVIEESGCEQEPQSPSPYPLSSEICRNALVSARFNKKVNGLNNSNIIVKKCNAGKDLDKNSCLIDVSGIISLASLNNKGFIFTPTSSWEQNYWYQVILKSGPTGIKDINGSQLDGNKNSIEEGSPFDDYIWYFKTNDQATNSPSTAVKVREEIPDGQRPGIITLPGTRNYLALALGPDCQILNHNSFAWGWESSKTGVVTVSGLVNAATATAIGLGETEIKATATSSIEGESSSGNINLIVAKAPRVSGYQPLGDNVCRNTLVSATFDQLMDEKTISSETIKLFGEYKAAQSGLICEKRPLGESNDIYKFFAHLWENVKKIFIWEAVAAKVGEGDDLWRCELPISIEIQKINNETVIKIKTQELFDQGRKYVVVLSGLLKNQYGLDLGQKQSWEFIPDELCLLSKVSIAPDNIFFEKKDQTEDLIARTYDDKGNEIYGISNVYDWTWSWESSNPATVSVSGSVLEKETITAENKNGQSQITATAKIIGSNPIVSVSGQSQVDVFLCENPWGPYEDEETNFRIKYCRDTKEKNNLLPQLQPPAISIGKEENLLKEFIFPIEYSGDIIGLKIIKNNRRLSPAKWYQENVLNLGSPQNIVIDGYYGLQEGRTTYVGAVNVDFGDFGRLAYINNYIYLISYNDKASDEVKDIFKQLLNNWKFNINLSNSSEKEEIQRDLLRIYDLEEIKEKVEAYKQNYGFYPALGQGTYVLGKTNSLWPSWQNTLGKILGASLPLDPVNKFNGSCANCSDKPDYQCKNTCYNSLTKVFEHPVGSHVYQYYAPEDPACLGFYYTLGANMEYSDRQVVWQGEDKIYINESDQVGITNYYYSSEEAPVCNDGILQCGEFCDTEEVALPPHASCTCNSTYTGWVCHSDWENCNSNWADGCEKKINGSSCGSDSDCCSGNCLDSVCRPANWQCSNIDDLCCDVNHRFKASTVVCGPKKGDCDFEEKCTGESAKCPPDLIAQIYQRVICRPVDGPCDVEEICEGSVNCSSINVKKPDGAKCGVCQICQSGKCKPTTAYAAKATALGCTSGDEGCRYCDKNDSYGNYCKTYDDNEHHACGPCQICQSGKCKPTTAYAADATALGCTSGGDQRCRYCDNGTCKVYTNNEHGACGVCQACNPSGSCSGQTVYAADATALGCTSGDQGCRYCDNGTCKTYILGQHSCSICHTCNADGICKAVTGQGARPYLKCGSGNCVDGVCCSLNYCSYNNQCYAPGNCHPVTPQQKCSNGKWVSSCGDGAVNCGEICDGQTNVPCGNCNLGLRDCFSCSWGLCQGGGACVPGETEAEAKTCRCKICNSNCEWNSESMCQSGDSCTGCSSCGGCTGEECCCYDRKKHTYYKGVCSRL
ncbi:MAG: Ig-like domain-containing protein [Patescibacteria group bacterium]|nr:Ig-like domain-containing protein [Patescibacteria group bacterium]